MPVAHARRAHAAMPGSRLEVVDEAGHFPFHTDPQHFVAVVENFLAMTAACPVERRTVAAAPARTGGSDVPADATERNAT